MKIHVVPTWMVNSLGSSSKRARVSRNSESSCSGADCLQCLSRQNVSCSSHASSFPLLRREMLQKVRDEGAWIQFSSKRLLGQQTPKQFKTAINCIEKYIFFQYNIHGILGYKRSSLHVNTFGDKCPQCMNKSNKNMKMLVCKYLLLNLCSRCCSCRLSQWPGVWGGEVLRPSKSASSRQTEGTAASYPSAGPGTTEGANLLLAGSQALGSDLPFPAAQSGSRIQVGAKPTHHWFTEQPRKLLLGVHVSTWSVSKLDLERVLETIRVTFCANAELCSMNVFHQRICNRSAWEPESFSVEMISMQDCSLISFVLCCQTDWSLHRWIAAKTHFVRGGTFFQRVAFSQEMLANNLLFREMKVFRAGQMIEQIVCALPGNAGFAGDKPVETTSQLPLLPCWTFLSLSQTKVNGLTSSSLKSPKRSKTTKPQKVSVLTSRMPFFGWSILCLRCWEEKRMVPWNRRQNTFEFSLAFSILSIHNHWIRRNGS